MVRLVHEKSRTEINPPLGHTGTASDFGSTSSGRLGRPEDRRPVAGLRRATPRLDCPGPGISAHELEPLGSPGECPGSRGLEACAETGAPVAFNPGSLQASGKGSGKVSPSPGAEPGAVGRPTLVTYLKRRWGLSLKVRQAQYWMHQLGYRMKRASYSYLQARAEEARGFQRVLKKTPRPGSA